MRHIVWRWLAASSFFLALLARAEVRPQYGGTLHVTMRAAPTTLDPADRGWQDSFGSRGVAFLIFDSLVEMDDSGQPGPALAESWQATRGNQRWEFRLRAGVKFSDGTPLTPEAAAASLRVANPSWNVSASGGTVIIEQDAADPEMLAELALARNSIAKRDSDKIAGTGPFRVTEWQAGKQLNLGANEEYWRGRPFVDGIQIEMGKSFRDQMTAFELRKADLIEVAPEQTHRFQQEGRSLTSAGRMELLALVFAKDATTPQEKLLRQALALSVERGSIRSVLLQGAGDPAAGILPTWVSGYGFVFSTDADLAKARQLRDQVRAIPTWTLAYDNSDGLSRLVAERVALNARDAGLSVRPMPDTIGDVRLLRVPIASGNPWVAFKQALSQAGLLAEKGKTESVEDLYAQEQSTLSSDRIVPLFHLPASYAASPGLRDWALRMDGSWNLHEAWLEAPKP